MKVLFCKGFVILGMLIVSCGKEESRLQTDGILGTGFGSATQVNLQGTFVDGDLALAEVGEQVAAVADALESIEQEGATALALSSDSVFKRYRICTEEEGKAIVNITRGLSFSHVRESDTLLFTNTVRMFSQMNRVWSKDETEISCHGSGKYVDLPIENISGIKLEESFTRKISRNLTLKHKSSEVEREREHQSQHVGTKEIDFLSIDSSGNNHLIAKSMTKNIEFQLQASNKAGAKRHIRRTVEVKAENPFSIDVERSKDIPHAVISRIIKNGVLVVTDQEGAKINSTYSDVLWLAAQGCMPISGSISGEIFYPESVAADITFVINFAGSNSTITFDNDLGEQPFRLGGCRLDSDASATEVGSADAAEDI